MHEHSILSPTDAVISEKFKSFLLLSLPVALFRHVYISSFSCSASCNCSCSCCSSCSRNILSAQSRAGASYRLAGYCTSQCTKYTHCCEVTCWPLCIQLFSLYHGWVVTVRSKINLCTSEVQLPDSRLIFSVVRPLVSCEQIIMLWYPTSTELASVVLLTVFYPSLCLS